jgi:hypothetical protein
MTVAQDDTSRTPVERLPYHAPRLDVLGDIRDLTLGPTPGLGDSGNPALRLAETSKAPRWEF